MTFENIKQQIENGVVTFENAHISDDGRVNSILDEKSIIEYLKAIFPGHVVEAPQERYWYDVALRFGDEFYPINIKSSTGESADNISSKGGLLYAVTGIDPSTRYIVPFANFEEALYDNIDYNGTSDYYFVVFFKNSHQLLFTSLKRINTLVPNGNNLPFQCKWRDNIQPTTRSNTEQIDYLISMYVQSVMKKLNSHVRTMERYFGGRQIA